MQRSRLPLPILIVSALAVSLTPMASSAQEAEPFFPLMAWSGAPNDPAKLQRMKECGLTLAGFAGPGSLDAIHAAGLKAIVQDGRCFHYDWASLDSAVLRRNMESLVKDVNQHPAVYGYYLKDEPIAAELPGLATAAAILKELAPGKWPYINLFPNLVSAERTGTKDYADYLSQFITLCKPPILSYDHYALMEHEPLRKGYWENLEIMREASIRNQIPFWNIVLTVAHFNYRVPTEGDYRFQAYSTLAYGGRGISYFTYFAPAVGNYRMSPVDQFGHETPTWYYMQNVNWQVQKLAPTLLKLTSTSVYHLGDVPDGCKAPSDMSLLLPFESGDFLVGEFSHEDGSRYLMVVNKHLTDSYRCIPNFRDDKTKVSMVSPYSGELTSFQGEQQWLAAGQGVLLRVQ